MIAGCKLSDPAYRAIWACLSVASAVAECTRRNRASDRTRPLQVRIGGETYSPSELRGWVEAVTNHAGGKAA